MKRLFRSSKTEWLSPLGHETAGVTRELLSRYLLGFYNWKWPPKANGDLAPAIAE
jgi:putative transposase